MRTLKPGWKILYRVGTPDRCRWNGAVGYFPTKPKAIAEAKRIARRGHKVVVMSERAYLSIGAPIGWAPEDLDAGTLDANGWWTRDAVEELVQA